MRKLYLLFVPLLYMLSACEKVNKDRLKSNNHQEMIGNWTYVHTIIDGAIDSSFPAQNFSITIDERCIKFIDAGNESKFKLYNIYNDDSGSVLEEWNGVYSFGSNNNTRYLEFRHVDNNTIWVERYPYHTQTTNFQLNGNVYKKLD